MFVVVVGGGGGGGGGVFLSLASSLGWGGGMYLKYNLGESVEVYHLYGLYNYSFLRHSDFQ